MEGFANFTIPSLASPAQTFYKVVGGFNSPAVRLVVLHGGPGACHEYLLPLEDLSPTTPLVFYDQIGNGRSTHLPEKACDEAFWSTGLFMDELDNLLEHLGLTEQPIDVYGHSWGGMLAVEWATKSPLASNLRQLVIASSLASMDVWRIGIDQLVQQLPEDVQEALARADETGDYESPEYLAAIDVFYQRHLSLARPWPVPEVQVALDWLTEDPTTYSTMYGLSELNISGSLRNWTSIPLLSKIGVPTLLINGEHDEAQDIAMQPFFDEIKGAKWHKIPDAAHFTHVDQRRVHIEHLRKFLQKQEYKSPEILEI